jgi:hypothetical protein
MPDPRRPRGRPPTNRPPQQGRAYEAWLANEHRITDLDKHKNHYETVASELKISFETSPFWIELRTLLPNVDIQYITKYHSPLISTPNPDIIKKSWPSFLEKTYRKNISDNRNYPSAPDAGWCLPSTWYTQIHDIVRTRIIVKYIDGVPLVLAALTDLAKTNDLRAIPTLEARDTGYYGAHFNLYLLQ